ncbi:HNH endonuclease [Pseudoalteromonas sp. MMG013]|uniref:HNH endonuclease signature motif containing protein n=1 Tax=Pseudoalteromonas sp. MMG013 TaxID=2822687 RepID=UPI001B39C677|nr:HNH endonuclease signature motif containing protein [Pseudoalteromonas sp. MMG013]MBQ4864391.1 HNH endonuclease [Pseudoalteromonas sp. MMG013]
MAISDGDAKLLWGRAAGICSNPGCRTDLTQVLEKARSYNVGEMAHIIARSEQGPRGITGGGADTYENLVLLCPTCHRHIDKSPEGTFTVEQLHGWKNDHEQAIRSLFSDKTFDTFEELKHQVAMLLIDNKSAWESFGPQSGAAEDPGSNTHKAWEFRKLDLIIPNNRKIVNMIEANKLLLDVSVLKVFATFKSHVSSFEQNQYERLDQYVTFPSAFSEVFEL